MIRIAILILLTTTDGKILRNNALMSQMVSNFHKDSSNTERDLEPVESKNEPVLSRMQKLLCKNFKTIPCELITQDSTLRKLIEKSIAQINYRKMKMEKTTQALRYVTLHPFVKEEYSNYVSDDYTKHAIEKVPSRHFKKTKNANSKHTTVYGRKNIKKFYPHKVKYRDKDIKKRLGDYSEDKFSMSEELPDMTLTKKHQHLSYKVEPANPPIWRIDYTKHGEPSYNMFSLGTDRHEDRMKTEHDAAAKDNILDQARRKDVLHSDIYIKNKYNVKNFNSDPIEK
ncbi:unnamed protein product [Leptidea sinapis]|uniref:Uncharacterized protein n=1 Tax=Leptidea sinapis TaxID=189913 RepID=A0A5E4Q5R8_9NEOP|nr:unnamed protein product [Leptidea sinapis]